MLFIVVAYYTPSIGIGALVCWYIVTMVHWCIDMC